MDLSDRVCQFYLRGRCQRENCEFKHCKPEKSSDMKEQEKEKEITAQEEKVTEAQAVAKKSIPPPPQEADVTTNDTSTFIASTTIEVAGNNQLTRRVAKGGTEEENSGNGKEIRRDSKGFEDFDDYFDSDANDTTAGDKTNEESSVQDDSVESVEEQPAQKEPEPEKAGKEEEQKQQQESNAFTSVPAPTETMPEEILDGDKTANANKKANLQDLSKEWDTEEEEEQPPGPTTQEAPQQQNDPGNKEVSVPEQTEPEVVPANSEVAPVQEKNPTENQQVPVQEEDQSNEETIENIENFLESEKKSGMPKEKWVTVVFDEQGKQIPDKSMGKIEKSVYDLDDEDFSATKATPFTGNRGKKSLIKTEGVVRTGNNTYYYTGNKDGVTGEESQDSQGEASTAGEDEEMDEQPMDGDGLITSDPYGPLEDNPDNDDLSSMQGDTASEAGTPSKRGRGYAQGRRKHNTNYVYGAKSTAAKTRRCGECEGCNREDCGKCPSCQDKPRFGGRGAKKQACIYRICTWKNPSGKRITPQTPNLANSPKGVPSGTIVSPAAVRRQQAGPEVSTTPKAETPSKGVKRGRGRGRKSISVVSPAVDGEEEDGDPGEVIKKGDDEYVVVVSGQNTGLSGNYWSTDGLDRSSRRRCTITPPPASTPTKQPDAESPTGNKKQSDDDTPPPAKRGRKPKDATTPATSNPKESEPTNTTSTPKSPRGRKRKTEEKSNEELSKRPEDSDQTKPSNGVSTGAQNRNISCLSDVNAAGSSQREVVVECFAPYDDHRWVNIGKERNGNPADAVQYARALRPPYQLLSFLRIKGNCSKGMGCSNKNTMVFVVLEGEITVVIHTTSFTAKKGDSFYIPPKNYYNLINNKAREAELSLLQYQYSGPLPSVPAGSQSGATSNGVPNQ